MSGLIISIHIPKTAGSSFGSYLKSRFGEQLYFIYPCERCKRFLHDTDQARLWASRVMGCPERGAQRV